MSSDWYCCRCTYRHTTSAECEHWRCSDCTVVDAQDSYLSATSCRHTYELRLPEATRFRETTSQGCRLSWDVTAFRSVIKQACISIGMPWIKSWNLQGTASMAADTFAEILERGVDWISNRPWTVAGHEALGLLAWFKTLRPWRAMVLCRVNRYYLVNSQPQKHAYCLWCLKVHKAFGGWNFLI